MGRGQPTSHLTSSIDETGVPRRTYLQLMLLGAMIPAELATMVKWSAPAGALLLGGTVAAGVSSEFAPRTWARLRSTDSNFVPVSKEGESHSVASLTMRFSAPGRAGLTAFARDHGPGSPLVMRILAPRTGTASAARWAPLFFY